MGDWMTCVCWDCKHLDEVPVEEIRAWLEFHWGHDVRIREASEGGSWIETNLRFKEAEG